MREVLIIVSVTEAHDRMLWAAEASGRNSLSAQESSGREGMGVEYAREIYRNESGQCGGGSHDC